MRLKYILIALVILAVILYFSRNKIKSMLTRGYINNNPGNLNRQVDANGKYMNVGDKGYKAFDGEVYSDDSRFRKFKDMAHGYRAMFINLTSYINSGTDSVQKIISRWAPSNENDTKSYINFVSKFSGKNPTDTIRKDDYITLRKLVAGISQQENGIPANLDDVDAGFKLLHA